MDAEQFIHILTGETWVTNEDQKFTWVIKAFLVKQAAIDMQTTLEKMLQEINTCNIDQREDLTNALGKLDYESAISVRDGDGRRVKYTIATTILS